MALPAALAAITAVSVLISGVWVIVDLNAKTSLNKRSALNALLVAEAGAAHGLALLRDDLKKTSFTRLLKGNDSVSGNDDDGYFTGYTALSSDKQIPVAGLSFGGGTYTVRITQDPQEADQYNDVNNRVLMTCVGTTPDGARAEVIGVVGVVPMPAMATEGSINIGGSPQILGPCGGLHANSVIAVSGNNVVVNGPLTASDSVEAGNCQIKKADGTCNVPLHNQPPIDIPILTKAEFCEAATAPVYHLGAGTITLNGVAASPAPTGWSYHAASDTWTNSSATPSNGTFCTDSNIEISGSPGDDGTPWGASLYTSKSIKVTGSPYIETYDQENEGLFIAEGDVYISGTSGSGYNYSGLIYAGAQCEMRGNSKIFGQVLCKDQPNPTGATNYVGTTNTNNTDPVTGTVTGNAQITFNCSATVLSKRKFLSWVQKLGS